MTKTPCVYIITNRRNGTLYIGVTSDIQKRIWEHKNKVVEGFSRRHDLDRFVWFEMHENMEAAITREKQIKKWKRDWKLALIEKENVNWRDLGEEWE